MIPAPPKLSDLPAGTQLRAGMGYATVLPEIDFETYSPAGFVWNAATGKFDAPQKGAKKGLKTVGAAVYSEHPDAEVLCLAYNLKDGAGPGLWFPGEPLPLRLLGHVMRGGLIEAWNSMFEYWIWNNVCVPKYNFVPLPQNQLRCAQAKARAFALPAHLADAGSVLNTAQQKDKEGKRLLNKFSIPRNPTKRDARWRILPCEDPADAMCLYRYCLQDIATEAELSSLCPDLIPSELEFWLIDQRINARGVQLDREMIDSCIQVVEAAHKKYNAIVASITWGDVKSISEIQKLRAWLETENIYTDTLDSADVTRLLSDPHISPNAREVLAIREMLGSAAVKKVYTMRNIMTRQGRAHDLFAYHGAHTGRAAGRALQPQNFPKSGPQVARCFDKKCGRHFDPGLLICPWCGCFSLRNQVKWSGGAIEDALETLRPGSLDLAEWYFGNAIELVSGILRGLIISAPGKDIICSDYSAIEAVVLAELAGETWQQEVFRTHGKIYESTASKVTGIPLDTILMHLAETGEHHAARAIGKTASLACFTPDTLVLTDRGYVPIKDVLLTDRLWDGIEWVNHEGSIYKGERDVIKLDGIEVTPDHPINLKNSWKAASLLASNANMLCRALEIGSENLPFFVANGSPDSIGSELNAPVTLNRIGCHRRIYDPESLLGAMYALKKNLLIASKNIIGVMRKLCQTMSTVVDYVIGYHRLSVDVTMKRTKLLLATGGAGSRFLPNGETIGASFYDIFKRSRGGITRIWRWTEPTLTAITPPGIFDSLREEKTRSISEASHPCKRESNFSKPVYDIVNAGRRHRFTIKTNSGHLLVHNSGYQGWINAWIAFGALEFMNEDEIKTAILAWREANQNIVEFWGGQRRYWTSEYYGVEGAAIQAILTPGKEYTCRSVSFVMQGDALYCRLPSGRYLTYHRPRLRPSERRSNELALSFEGFDSISGWCRRDTWGGRLVENITQAVARDILAHAIVALERSGYPVVLHVHDEIVSEIPENWGSIDEFESIMSTMPSWAGGWPVKAVGGYRAKRYRK